MGSFAQLNGDGYYRVKNVASERYITVRDNRGSVNIGTSSADMGAVELYKGFDNVVSDPSSVLYIQNAGDNNYKFHAQGTDTYEIIGYYLKLKKNSDGSYKAYQGNSMMVMYLGDSETTSVVDGKLSTNAKGQYRDWYILPLNSSSSDNYFGISPEVKAADANYASFYAVQGAKFLPLSNNIDSQVNIAISQGGDISIGSLSTSVTFSEEQVSIIQVDNEGNLNGGISKFIDDERKAKIFERMNVKPNSAIFFVADEWKGSSEDGHIVFLKGEYKVKLNYNGAALSIYKGTQLIHNELVLGTMSVAEFIDHINKVINNQN